MCVCLSMCVCECEGEREKETRLPQQLCHYVGGNYESDENGEGERIGAKKKKKKALTLKRERKLSIRARSALGIQGRLEVRVTSRRDGGGGQLRHLRHVRGE